MKRDRLPLRDVGHLGARLAGCLGAMQWAGATSEAHAHALLDLAVNERGVRTIGPRFPRSAMLVRATQRANRGCQWRARVAVATKVAGPLLSTFTKRARF
jgi:hypothetical protein